MALSPELQSFLQNVVRPGIVIGAFLFLGGAILLLWVKKAGWRGFAASLIPLVTMTFAIQLGGEGWVLFLSFVPWPLMLLGGIGIGLACVASPRVDDEGGAAVLAFFLAAVLCLLLFTFSIQPGPNEKGIEFFSYGFIVAGLAYIAIVGNPFTA